MEEYRLKLSENKVSYRISGITRSNIPQTEKNVHYCSSKLILTTQYCWYYSVKKDEKGHAHNIHGVNETHRMFF